MNENILNGLLNLFALFTSLVKITQEQAYKTVGIYLTNHFGIRSKGEYMALFDELQDMYNNHELGMDKEGVVVDVCARLKPELATEEQLLLLLRFMEFVHSSAGGLENNLSVFHKIADVFNVDQLTFELLHAFVAGGESQFIVTIDSDSSDRANHICSRNMEGVIRVLYLEQCDRLIFTYLGSGGVFMNDNPIISGIFYRWQRSGVVKSSSCSPVYYNDVQEVLNQSKSLEQITLTGRDVNFRFSGSKNGLHNFSFDLKSGQLTAIMGGSGVGKSTLISILNGSLAPLEGSVCLNGHPVTEQDCRRLIGFVPQDDLLIGELTVFQNLWYTARLCFADQSKEEIRARVDSILEDLDLVKERDLLVGSPLRKTISGGQRKRLNIALELIREPSILYLDEPTSGLSSTDSEKVIMLLKEQTHRGRLVVANVHQPSSDIYKLFDRLWLLDTGGYPIYDGNPIDAITYFKSIVNYTDRNIGICNTCGNVNPEQILNIIDSKKIDEAGNMTNTRKLTPKEWYECYLDARPEFQEVTQQPLPANQQKRPSCWKQFCIFIARNVRTKMANKQYLGIALLIVPLLAVIVALLAHYAAEDGYYLLGNKNLGTYLFMSISAVTFTGLCISAEEIIKDRTLLRRERFLQLSRRSYLTSKIVYLLCVSCLQSLLFVAIGNGLIRIGAEMFLTWWIILWATSFVACLTGLLLSQTLSSTVAIYITIPLLIIPQMMLGGMAIKFDELSRNALERNVVPIVGDIIPSRWAFEALATEQFRNNSYNRLFFDIEKEKFLAQYYRNIHLGEVRNIVDRLDAYPEKREGNILTIENELAVLGRSARIAPRTPDESYESYLNKAEQALTARADNFTALLDMKRKELVDLHGSEWLTALKRNHHSQTIESLVLNLWRDQYFIHAYNRIYPKIGQIYMEPDNKYGRAHMFAHQKKIGNYTFSTLTYNLLVLGLFALLLIAAIFAEFPSRYLNREKY